MDIRASESLVLVRDAASLQDTLRILYLSVTILFKTGITIHKSLRIL